MRWKTTCFLLITTVGIGVYVSLYELKRPTPDEQEQLANEVVQLPAEDVTSLMVESPQAKVSLQRRNGSWRLASPIDVRAEESLVRRIINGLNPLEAERALSGSKEKPFSWGDFGLEPPRATLAATAGSRAIKLLFGDKTAVGNNRYLKLADSPTLFIASPSLFDTLNQPLDAYRSHELLDFETDSASQVTSTSPSGSYTLRKHAQHWQLTEPLVDQADGTAVSNLFSTLRGLRVERFIADATAGGAGAPPSSEWGFEAPSARVTIAFENAAAPLELVVGKPTAEEPEHLYAKRTDESTIYAVTKSGIDELLQDPQALRSRTVLDVVVGRVAKLHVSWQETSWTTEQRDEQWKLAEDGRALDHSKVEEWLWKLHDTKLTRFVEDHPQSLGPYGLEPPTGLIQVWVTDQQEPNEVLIGNAIPRGKTRYGHVKGRASVVELPESILELLTTTPDSFTAQPESATASPPQNNQF